MANYKKQSSSSAKKQSSAKEYAATEGTPHSRERQSLVSTPKGSAGEERDSQRQSKSQADAVTAFEQAGLEKERARLRFTVNTKTATKDLAGRVDKEPIKPQEMEDIKNGTAGYGPGITEDAVDDLEVIDQEQAGQVVDQIIAGPLQGTVAGAAPLTEPQRVQAVLDEKSKAGQERKEASAQELQAAKKSVARIED